MTGYQQDYVYNLAAAVRALAPEAYDSHLFALEVRLHIYVFGASASCWDPLSDITQSLFPPCYRHDCASWIEHRHRQNILNLKAYCRMTSFTGYRTTKQRHSWNKYAVTFWVTTAAAVTGTESSYALCTASQYVMSCWGIQVGCLRIQALLRHRFPTIQATSLAMACALRNSELLVDALSRQC